VVDDLDRLEAGRRPDGSPDLYFRDLHCRHSELGATTLGMAVLSNFVVIHMSEAHHAARRCRSMPTDSH